MTAAGEGAHIMQRPDHRRVLRHAGEKRFIVEEARDPMKIHDITCRQLVHQGRTEKGSLVAERFVPPMGENADIAGSARVIASRRIRRRRRVSGSSGEWKRVTLGSEPVCSFTSIVERCPARWSPLCIR